MVSQNRPGTCLLCRKEVSKRAALRHARNCLRISKWPASIYPSSIIRVQDKHNPACWLLILARHDAQLSDLDCLIRDVWAGCCNHPGIFITESCIFTGDGESAAITDVVRTNNSFTYNNTFETPAEPGLKVLGATPVTPPKEPLCIIAHSMGFGVCSNTKNPVAAVRWYPPGWNGEELPSATIVKQVCSEDECSTPDVLSEVSVNVPEAVTTRTSMIQNRCTEFCARIEDEAIRKRCGKIVTELDAHQNVPLSRGDDVLWSAAIVYLACQEEGLIVRTKGGSPLAHDICEYFDLKLPSVRSKVTALKKYLAYGV